MPERAGAGSGRLCRVLVGLGLLVSLFPVQTPGAPRRPNVILITVDTFRPDRLGYYGYPKNTSPNLDAISREGAFFTQAFSSSGWTTPGLISTLTSLYPPTHGVDIRARRLDPKVVTLPDVLRDAGYRVPDIFFLTVLPNFSNLGLEAYSRRAEYIHQGDEILFRWLSEEAGEDQPFFLYYHYRDLHLPYDPGPRYEAMFLPQAFESAVPLVSGFRRFLAKDKMEVVKQNVMLVRGVMDFGPGDRSWVDALYDAQIHRLDQEFFGRLRRTLDELGLARNTLLVISADHGEELLDHGLIGHVSTYKEGRLYDEVIRIPLVVRLPGVIPAGLVVDEPVQCIDTMPTILELLGLDPPKGAQGRSLVPLIQQRPGWERGPLYFETSGGGYTADPEQYAQRVRAVRARQWKLIHAMPSDDYRLHDLARDPAESQDWKAVYPEVTDSLRRALNRWVLYTQRQPYRREDRIQVAGQADAPGGRSAVDRRGPPRILSPGDGDTLRYQGANHSIRPRWSGPAGDSYAIEYRVGRGAYALAGVITETSSTPEYGPFQASFWNALVLYNPWQFRVYRESRPAEKSDWVTFHLAPTGETAEAYSLISTWSQLWFGAPVVLEQTGHLLLGLARGLADLGAWAASAPSADMGAYALLISIGVAAAWPLLRRLGVARVRAWGLALLYIALVYSTIPLMPQVWKVLGEYTRGAVQYFGIFAVVVAGGVLLGRTWLRVRARAWTPYAALVLIAPIYVFLLQRFATFPAERVHLVEYGFVGYFLFRGLAIDLAVRRAYVASFALTVLVGFGDESIQWILPGRFFELKDVWLNAISGGLGLLVLRFVSGPREGEP